MGSPRPRTPLPRKVGFCKRPISCKLLKRWSGRRDSNPRRPAWEYDCKLETKNIAFPGTSFWRLRIPSFHSVLSSWINGAHAGKRFVRLPGPRIADVASLVANGLDSLPRCRGLHRNPGRTKASEQ